MEMGFGIVVQLTEFCNHNCYHKLQVFAIICVDDPGDLDKISLDLPIMKKLGDKVHITCKSICHVTKWIDDLEQIDQL